MPSWILAILLFISALLPIGAVITWNWDGHTWTFLNGSGQVYGAPGPEIGAGLPFLVAGGGLTYILSRRRRKKK